MDVKLYTEENMNRWVLAYCALCLLGGWKFSKLSTIKKIALVSSILGVTYVGYKIITTEKPADVYPDDYDDPRYW